MDDAETSYTEWSILLLLYKALLHFNICALVNQKDKNQHNDYHAAKHVGLIITIY